MYWHAMRSARRWCVSRVNNRVLTLNKNAPTCRIEKRKMKKKNFHILFVRLQCLLDGGQQRIGCGTNIGKQLNNIEVIEDTGIRGTSLFRFRRSKKPIEAEIGVCVTKTTIFKLSSSFRTHFSFIKSFFPNYSHIYFLCVTILFGFKFSTIKLL